MSTIHDGSGKNFDAKVNGNLRLYVDSVQREEDTEATKKGDSYNLNTGWIELSGSATSTLMYVKNNESQDLVVNAIALGVGTGVAANVTELYLHRNPTGGDLVTDGTAIAYNGNRNFGSNETLTADTYKGKQGGTISGGAIIATFGQSHNGRMFAPIALDLPKGASLGLTVVPNTSSGAAVRMYAAIVCHLKDNNE